MSATLRRTAIPTCATMPEKRVVAFARRISARRNSDDSNEPAACSHANR